MSIYIVTGGTGFIGRALVDHLRTEGHRVIVASRTRPHAMNDEDWIEYDLRNPESVNNIVNVQPDGVYHLAWSTTPATAEKSPAADVITNLAGTVNLFDKLSSGPATRIVVASSGGTVYGIQGSQPIPETVTPEPISLYGTTKLAMEKYALRYKRVTSMDIRIARVSNPFGTGQPLAKMQGAATIFARKIVSGEPIQIWGDGSVVRDYVDVNDVASGLAAIMKIDQKDCATFPVFNLGSGIGLSLHELIKQLEKLGTIKANVTFQPNRGFDVPFNILDVSKLIACTDWKPGNVIDQLALLVDELRQSALDQK